MTNGLKAWGAVLFAAAVTALFVWIGATQLEAPPPRPNAAFDGARAFNTLSKLLAEERPHIAGSPENMVVRDRIVAELKAHGYETELQAALQCGPPDRFPGCTQIENVIAVKKGSRPGKALLVTAHYDSVPAGPGVGDDGAGTAMVLEYARTLSSRTIKNDVIFLITDGEETGLRGAYAFAERHPLMKQVGLILNFEARGASGPSMMFETGPRSAKLIELFAQVVPQPYANSLLYEIYRLMPNDTDFSVYRRAGYNGFNFAFTGSGALYHSERDNLANLDRNTFQHHGDNLFALADALVDADLDAFKSDADASYFDLFGKTMIVWPASLNLPLALIALAALVALIAANRSAFSLRGAALALGALIAAPFLLFALGWLLAYPLGVWPGVHPIDHANPWAARIALTAAGFMAALVVAAAARRTDPRALTLIAGLAFAMIGATLAWFITGASYLFIFPALALAAAGWIEYALRGRLDVSAWIAFVVAAFFWLPFFPRLDLVLGFDLSAFKILALTPVVWVLAPPLSAALRGAQARLPVAIAAFVTAAAAALASQTPAYAENHPRGLNVVYFDDRTASPRWLIAFTGGPDEDYLKKTGFPARDERYMQFGLIEAEGRLKPATDLQLAPPTLVIDELKVDGARAIAVGRLRGGRGGLQLALAVAPGSGVREIRAGGELWVAAERLSQQTPVLARIAGWGDRDLPVVVTFDAAKKPSLTLIERSALPEGPEAQALLAARPRDAAPSHSGNAAIVMVKVELAP